MAQKYSRNSASRISQKSSNESGSSLQTFLAGLLVGALGTHFLPMLMQNKDLISEQIPGQDMEIVTPDFQFTDILKGAEIKVPDSAPEPPAETDSTYLLQVGSFINQRDAESLRVRLLLLNFKAFVEPFETDTGDSWHRVYVGPYDEENQTISARTKLAESDLNSLLLKRKN